MRPLTEEREFMPVILGADITAYSLARTFHEAYRVKSLVVSQKQAKIISESRIIENRVVPGMDDPEKLVGTLISIGREFGDRKKLILLGCGDFYVRNFVENKDRLKDYYVIPYIDLDLYNQVVLKDKFYETCDKLDIPHPKTYAYNCGEENDLKFDFDYPVIAKTASSAQYHYAEFPGKKKVFKFYNEKDLRQMLSNLEKSSYNYKFLIQDMIPGDDEYMRVLTCYSDRNGKVKFASLGHSLLEDHTPSAIGNPVCIVNETNDKIVEDATRFLEYVGYTGFSNFDIKYDRRDGSYKFFEINVRLGRSNYYNTAAGYNVAKWMVDDLIYHKQLDYVKADRQALFTVVPRGIINRYVKDPANRALVDKMYKEHKVFYPLDYKPDMSPVRSFYVFASLMNQYRKYYLAEKSGDWKAD